MKKQYGVSWNTYGHILPGTEKISKIYSPSKQAKQRLQRIEQILP